MPTKKAATVSGIRPATNDHKPKQGKAARAPRDGGVAEVIDFDAELRSSNEARVSRKFRLGGHDYSLGKGPNAWQMQHIDQTEDFDITEFLSQFVIPKERKQFIAFVREADLDFADFNLLQRRLMEASAGRPIEAS